MARTTTRQKPKLSPVARRRAAKKRAAHVLKITVVDDHGNAEVPAHPKRGLQFDALYRTIAALRLAQAESDLARHVLKEGLSEVNPDDWDDELDQPLFDEEEFDDKEEIDPEVDDMFARWDADLKEMFPEDLQPVDDHDLVYGDHLLDTDEFVDHGAYGTYRGVHTLQQGFSLDAVFGEGHRGGNCGFSVRTRP